MAAASAACVCTCVYADEIGDTWVFGVQSDPLKTANFRAASRLRAACIADPACPSEVRSPNNTSKSSKSSASVPVLGAVNGTASSSACTYSCN